MPGQGQRLVQPDLARYASFRILEIGPRRTCMRHQPSLAPGSFGQRGQSNHLAMSFDSPSFHDLDNVYKARKGPAEDTIGQQTSDSLVILPFRPWIFDKVDT